MKLFRSKESNKKHEKAKQDKMSLVSDSPVHMPPAPVLPNQDAVYTQRSLQRQQPAQDYPPQRNSHTQTYTHTNSHPGPREEHPLPVRKSRDQDFPHPTAAGHSPRLRAQAQAQAQAHAQSQPSPAHAHKQAPAPMHMSQPSPVHKSEVRVETLKQTTQRHHYLDAEADVPAPAPARAMGSASALKEAFGVDPVAQMAHNAVTRELIKQFIADIWNRGDLDLIPNVCAKGIRFNGSSGMDRVGHDGFKRMVTTIRSSLEDYHCEIHSMVVEGNKAFCRLRFMGRHVGKLLGYDPTGRQVSWMGVMEFTVMDGFIIKVWELRDMSWSVVEGEA
jgi:predicted ester cyclase